jgi:hypothetical protein
MPSLPDCVASVTRSMSALAFGVLAFGDVLQDAHQADDGPTTGPRAVGVALNVTSTGNAVPSRRRPVNSSCAQNCERRRLRSSAGRAFA